MAAHVLYPDFDEDRLLRFRGTYDRALHQSSGINEVSRSYCVIAGEESGLKSNRELAHKGRVALSNMRKAKNVPAPVRVWNLFEAFRTDRVPWASGVVGLHSAEHFSELIGLYYTFKKRVECHEDRDGSDLAPG